MPTPSPNPIPTSPTQVATRRALLNALPCVLLSSPCPPCAPPCPKASPTQQSPPVIKAPKCDTQSTVPMPKNARKLSTKFEQIFIARNLLLIDALNGSFLCILTNLNNYKGSKAIVPQLVPKAITEGLEKYVLSI